jgi:twitching motility two-component system response regulator PilG
MSESAGQNSLDLGIAAAKSGSRLVARLRLRDAAERSPQDAVCWLWLAWMAETPAEAVAHLQKAVALDPDNEIAWAGLRWAQGMATSPRADRAQAGSSRDRLARIAAEAPAPVSSPVAPIHATPEPHRPSYAAPTATNGSSAEVAERHVPHAEAAPEPLDGAGPADDGQDVLQALQEAEDGADEAEDRGAEADAAGGVEEADDEDRSHPTVLVVDDSPTVCKLVMITLANNGYRVLSSADGVDAVSLISKTKPDLILCDITMPRLDGYKLCKLVKSHEDTKHIPVVMLSGKDGFFDKTRGKFAGCTDYITKPFDPDSLLQAVRRYVPSDGPRGGARAGLSRQPAGLA